MSRKKILVASLLLAAVGVVLLFAITVSRPRVVARAVAPNGIEFCMVQRLGEPFTTSAYYRKPGGPWRGFYYDHEDDFWTGGPVEIDSAEKRLKVFRGAKLTASFHWEKEEFYHVGFHRVSTNADALPHGKNPWE